MKPQICAILVRIHTSLVHVWIAGGIGILWRAGFPSRRWAIMGSPAHIQFAEPPFRAVLFSGGDLRLSLTPAGKMYLVQQWDGDCWQFLNCSKSASMIATQLNRAGVSPLHPIFGVVHVMPSMAFAYGWSLGNALGRVAYHARPVVCPVPVVLPRPDGGSNA